MNREAFEAALVANEDDEMTRLVYADWLDDHGEHEEADRQRKWTAAKAWLVAFYTNAREERRKTQKRYRDEARSLYASRGKPAPEDYDDFEDEYLTDFGRVIEAAREAFVNGDMACGNSEWLCDVLRSDADSFWKHACVYLGYPYPKELPGFYCAC